MLYCQSQNNTTRSIACFPPATRNPNALPRREASLARKRREWWGQESARELRPGTGLLAAPPYFHAGRSSHFNLSQVLVGDRFPMLKPSQKRLVSVIIAAVAASLLLGGCARPGAFWQRENKKPLPETLRLPSISAIIA
jgi:hypothetical protein